MPLPPALAARLAKRGLLKDASVAGYDPQLGKAVEPVHGRGRNGLVQVGGAGHRGGSGGGGGVPSYGYEGRNLAEPEEEVFAENYDEQVVNQSYERVKSGHTTAAHDPTRFIGHCGCPNKWNVYHDCSPYCKQFWGAGLREPIDQEYIEAHNKMIEKYYPLPDGWREMYDAGVGRHYYWCTKTDKVSWLPPGHPKAKITDAASKVREAMAGRKSEERFTAAEKDDDNMDLESDGGDSDDDAEEDRRLEEQRRREKQERKEEERRFAGKKRKGRGDDDGALDPMDPAAYSDVPRGSWATGLEQGGGGKSGVDSTAAGPIFQQRPYPSPGDILRANAARNDN